MKVKIRKARKEDLKDMARIMKTEYAKEPYNEGWDEKTSLKKVKEYFKNIEIYIAESDKEIIGFIMFSYSFWYDGLKAYIKELVIDNKFQGKGFRTKLIKIIENILLKKGVNKIWLKSSIKSKAMNFYKDLNYKETGFIVLEKRLR